MQHLVVGAINLASSTFRCLVRRPAAAAAALISLADRNYKLTVTSSGRHSLGEIGLAPHRQRLKLTELLMLLISRVPGRVFGSVRWVTSSVMWPLQKFLIFVLFVLTTVTSCCLIRWCWRLCRHSWKKQQCTCQQQTVTYGTTWRSRDQSCQPVGIYNIGATCYFNALMQCIYQTHLMESTLEQHPSLTVSRVRGKVVKLNRSNWQAFIRDSEKNVLLRTDQPSCAGCSREMEIFQDLAASRNDVIFAFLESSAFSEEQEHSIQLFVKGTNTDYTVQQFPADMMPPTENELVEFLDNDGDIHRNRLSLVRCVCKLLRAVEKHCIERCLDCYCACWMKCLTWCGNRLPFSLLMNTISRCGALWQQLLFCVMCKLHPQVYTEADAAESLKEFYQQITELSVKNASSRDNISFNPQQLFNALCRRSSRFYGGRQQDSHEALRHLMEAVKQEEKEIVWSGDSNIDSSQLYRRLTVVDRVFGGHYLTVFHCYECHTPYHLFEPFLDVSLPVAYDQVDQQENLNPDETSTTRDRDLIDLHPETDLHHETSPLLVDIDTAETDPTPVVPQPQLTVIRPSTTSPGLLSHYVDAISQISTRLDPSDIGTTKTSHHSVIDSLRFYTRKEELNEYLCLTCNKVTNGCKQTIIFNPPAILTLHLKRFEQGRTGKYTKVTHHVAFEQHLDLAPFCSKYSLRRQCEPMVRYSLYGVVSHSGSLQGGHYTACVRVHNPNVEQTKAFLQQTFVDRDELMSKESLVELMRSQEQQQEMINVGDTETVNNPRADTWYSVSDTSVSTIRAEEVFRKEAYLLFYERVY